MDKMKSRKACKRQLTHSFKSFDQFGQSVSFTYDGEDQFKTTLGATVSLIITIILLGYGIYKATVLFGKNNPAISKTTLIRSIWEGDDFYPQEYGFDFAFGLTKDLDPTYGYFMARQVTYVLTNETNADGSKKKSKTVENLTFAKCNTDGFNFYNQDIVAAFGIQNYLCMDNADYVFKGNFYSEEFKYLDLRLFKCQNSTSSAVKCKSQAAIDAYFESEIFNFAFVNTYFDSDSYGDEIKQFIDDSLFFELEAAKSKKANFYIQQQEAELEDDYIQLGQTRDIEFHQVLNIRTYDDNYSVEDGFIVAIYMRLDKTYDSYQRKIYSILDLLGDVGGLQGSLLSIGVFLIGFIAQKIFMSNAIKKIYQIRKQNDCNDIYEDNNHHNKNKVVDSRHVQAQTKNKLHNQQSYNLNGSIPLEQNTLRETNKVDYGASLWHTNDTPNYEREPIHQVNSISAEHQHNEMEDSMVKEKLSIKSKEELLQNEFKNKDAIRPSDIGNLIYCMINRTRFRYNYQNIIQYILQCLCIRSLDDNKHKRSVRKHFLFDKAQEKLTMELDFVRIVKTLRKFKMLSQAMLSQKDRMILKFQKQNLIETSSSSSDSDDGDFDAVRMMENKNPFTRLAIFGRMKKMMEGYQGSKLKKLQANMMRGIFIKNLKDFNETQKEKASSDTLLMRLKEQMKIDEDDDGPFKIQPQVTKIQETDHHLRSSGENLPNLRKDRLSEMMAIIESKKSGYS